MSQGEELCFELDHVVYFNLAKDVRLVSVHDEVVPCYLLGKNVDKALCDKYIMHWKHLRCKCKNRYQHNERMGV